MNSIEMQARIEELPEIIEGLMIERDAIERAGDVKKLMDVNARIDIASAELRRLTVEIHPVKKSELQAEAERLEIVANAEAERFKAIKAQVEAELRPRFGHIDNGIHAINFGQVVQHEATVFEAEARSRAAGYAAMSAATKAALYQA